ncbi:MAG: alpha-1,2-fucosyltransferase [Candidatus Aenigmarchaeota archaeon]|nr:alpha-1,2-fucosyltransferase [Candidatus Aenigmarchaeota archaeon]
MGIVRLTGGLGNQMFQAAIAKSLELKQKTTVKLDADFYKICPKNMGFHNGLEIDRIFNITNFTTKKENQKFKGLYILWMNKEWSFTTVEKKILGKNIFFKLKDNFVVDDNPAKFNKNYLNLKDDFYLSGCFQSYKYFKEYDEEIRKLFLFPKIADKKNAFILKKIKNTNSVSIHVRRGDYLNKMNAELNVVDSRYYKSAIKTIAKEVKNPVFFIFSDDINWCKENFEYLGEKYYIDWNKKKESFRDMQLISSCKHNIIANSSFSWWGTWLNKNPNKIVICPEYWLNGVLNNYDRCPEDWKRMAVKPELE